MPDWELVVPRSEEDDEDNWIERVGWTAVAFIWTVAAVMIWRATGPSVCFLWKDGAAWCLGG